MNDNYYHILRISYTATPEEIKTAYRQLAKAYHPDRNPGQEDIEEYFKTITQAYIVLSDPQKKSQYDWNLYRKYGINTNSSATAHQGPATQYTARQAYRQRSYNHPNPFYRGTRYQYSKKVRRQGALFIVGFVLVVISFPVMLEIFAAERYYQKGLEFYREQNYFAAINNFDLALRDLGQRNTDACLLAARIMIYHYNDHTYTFKYLERGLAYADEDREFAQLHYLKGLCLREQKKYQRAINNFQTAQRYKPGYDSAIYEMAQVQAFFLNDFAEGLKSFNLLSAESGSYQSAFFGKGFCHYHLHDYKTAVDDFERFINYKDNQGYSYYLKGLSEVKLNQDSIACRDFKLAWNLGVKEAETALQVECGIATPPFDKKFDLAD